jgi:hypothetical protein
MFQDRFGEIVATNAHPEKFMEAEAEIEMLKGFEHQEI